MSRRFAPSLPFLALLLAGCAGQEMTEPVYELQPEEFVVVMPFKDPDFGNRWDSPRSHDLGERTTAVLSENCEFGVRPYDKIIDLYRADDVKKLTPRDVAALTRADYVLVCDVTQFDLSEKKTVNMPRGTAKATVKLFKVERRSAEDEELERKKAEEEEEARRKAKLPTRAWVEGGRWVREDTITVIFPSDYYQNFGAGNLEPDQIEEGLIAVMSRKVAKLYYSHPLEKIEVE